MNDRPTFSLKYNLCFIKYRLCFDQFKFNFIKYNLNFKNTHGLALLMLLVFICFSRSTMAQTGEEVLRKWTATAVVDDADVERFGIDKCFAALPISDAVFSRMQGKSYKKGCTIPREKLRYLHVLHRNVEGKTQLGEIVCNASIANDLIVIFRQLYDAGYKIERMVLIDNYDADDERSMSANNTSCFNFRNVAGTTKLSKHSQGLAIDINPLYNPCISLGTGKVEPAAGKRYAVERAKITGTKVPLIDKKDPCYTLFKNYGFKWGGNWMSKKDYQHFEK